MTIDYTPTGNSGGGGGCLQVIVAVAVLLLAVAFCAGAPSGGDTGGGLFTTNTRTTTTRTDARFASDNTVRILSPDTYIYYNSGDTSQVVSGDRNQVAPVQTGGGQCWVSSAGAWGPCPAYAPEGSAVP